MQSQANSRCVVQVSEFAEGALVKISGVINETLDLSAVSSKRRGVVIVDFDELTHITSFGVRKWREALPTIACDFLGFVRCRPQILTQFNSVARFGGAGELISFYLPYLCPECGHQDEVLLDLRKQHGLVASLSAPELFCSQCKAATELDDVPSIYFRYPAKAPAPKPPREAVALLSQIASMRIEKDVDGSVTALWLFGKLDATPGLKRLLSGVEGLLLIIAAGIEDTSVEGLERLKSVFALAKVDQFIGRLPAALASHLIQNPKILGATRVVSVIVPSLCLKCNQVSGIELTSFGESAAHKAASCQACGGTTKPDRALLERLQPLVLAPAPQEITEYLSAHRSAPVLEVPSGVNEQLGRFKIMTPLGIGGMAEVFLARMQGAGGFTKTVVLKRILPHLAAHPSFVDMFLSEARLSARISHPNVVQTLDVGREGSSYFIALEYVAGRDLSMILSVSRRLNFEMPVDVAVYIADCICAGLQAAHNARDENEVVTPIVHRDVSPSNVLVSSEGEVKLGDFGIARAADSFRGTPTNSFKGKLKYLAPEVLTGTSEHLDVRVDIYATGLILYQCLTMSIPFAQTTDVALMREILGSEVPLPSTIRPTVTPALDTVVRRATRPIPSQRYATTAEFRADLRNEISTSKLDASKERTATWFADLLQMAKAQGLDFAIVRPPSSKGTPWHTEHVTTASEVTPVTKMAPGGPNTPDSKP